DYLSGVLPGYMIPSYFVLLDEIPLTTSGKLNRKGLPAPGVFVGDDYATATDDIEKRLVEIWSIVLGIEKEKLSIDANFFQLGGHSLRATILVARIRKDFNVLLPVAKVFSGPTIREFAQFIKKTKKSIFDEIKAVEKREYYLQSSAQKRLFFLEQLEEIGVSYNIPSLLAVRGAFAKDRYQQAIRKLIQRHEALRTSFLVIEPQA
ncbi:MAG: hypothetical protein GY940_41065, partial [bacterium]|nr:hypothetical protein [bacterium]